MWPRAIRQAQRGVSPPNFWGLGQRACGQVGAERQKRAFQTWATKKGVAAVGQALDHDWDRLVTFYQFPKAHWKHLRTTNPIESPFAAVRLRTTAAKRFKRIENATAVIWRTLLVAEQ